MILFDSLNHDFETANCRPNHEDKIAFKEGHPIEKCGKETTKDDKYCLSNTSAHGREVDLSPVIDFFYEKKE